MSQLKEIITTLGGAPEAKIVSPFKTKTFYATAEDVLFDSSLVQGKAYVCFVAQVDGQFKGTAEKPGKPYKAKEWFVMDAK